MSEANAPCRAETGGRRHQRAQALREAARGTVTPRITEKQLQDAIVECATLLGWRVFHPWTSIHSAAGYPDLTLVRPPRVILAELKSATGKLSPDQDDWLRDLMLCPGVEAYLWTPEAWLSGRIEEVLRDG
jgi:hypothetical protein